MVPPCLGDRVSIRLDHCALFVLLGVLSACAPADSSGAAPGGAGTGGKGSGGNGTTPGTGGVSGTGGAAIGSGGAATGGVTGSGGAGTGNGGAVGSGGSGTGNATAAPSCTPVGPGTSDCGADHESCCTSLPVAGGTYFRTYQNSGTSPTGTANPATISDFRLDKYLVTVGRYRQFATAWTGGWRPASGAGKHGHLTAGGLATTGGGTEIGWDPSWNTTMNVNPTTASLTRGSFCDGTHATWTAAATGGHEDLPINCVNWFESYAFCIWDGGFLPSEAEWEYAAAGGSEQRRYPWGSAAPGMTNQYAIYGAFYTGNATGLAPVGTAASGAGRWGHLDLAGEIWEWALDWKQNYVNPCLDCVNLTPADFRIVRGGDIAPDGRDSNFGLRCARAP